MTQYLEPCPMCGDFVPYTTALDDGEDVRWAEWSCPCGLYYHAESRIVNERGVHDAEAEMAELFGAWNTRAVRTCRPLPVYNENSPWPTMTCSECGRSLHYDERGEECDYQPYCGCGAKVVDE